MKKHCSLLLTLVLAATAAFAQAPPRTILQPNPTRMRVVVPRLTYTSTVQDALNSPDFATLPAEVQMNLRKANPATPLARLPLGRSLDLCKICANCCISPVATVPGAVTSTVVDAGNGVRIKLYKRDRLAKADVKGLVLMGAGTDESSPTPSAGSLDGLLENAVCNKLAADNYVCAVVAYRPGQPVDWTDGGASWNARTGLLATDFSNVATFLVSSYGGSRARLVAGGVSFASFALLSNLAYATSPLRDCAGILAICGATDKSKAGTQQVPVGNLVCGGDGEGQSEGQKTGPALYSLLPAAVKARSRCETDNTCNGHCGGADGAKWRDFCVERVKFWLP